MSPEYARKKVEHYEWMLTRLNLSEAHRYWITKEMPELKKIANTQLTKETK
jgi:hypothetical protein